MTTSTKSREGEGSEVLSLLPFTITKVIQYDRKVIQHGRNNPRYELVLDDGVTIRVKSVSMLLSGKKMRVALFNAGYFLHSSIVKRWDEITEALMGLIVVEPIDSEREEARR